MGPIQQRITQKLTDDILVEHLEVINESHMHNVPPGSESHFKITIVSDAFSGKTLLAQHRLVNAILKDELENDIHALALHTYTPEQWHESRGISPESPPCLGGGK
jgi:BolA protein